MQKVSLLLAVTLFAASCGSSSSDDQIVFSSTRYGDSEIFVMDADGSDVYSTGQKGLDPDWRSYKKPHS